VTVKEPIPKDVTAFKIGKRLAYSAVVLQEENLVEIDRILFLTQRHKGLEVNIVAKPNITSLRGA